MVAAWLLAICVLLALMVVVGGATRLTGSGLSITEWRPITGVVPPMSAAAWQEAFESYRKIPQYQHVNRGMSLEAFKAIYWWEWGHRLLGRLIGFAVLLPFAWFFFTHKIGRNLARRLFLIFALGAAQGILGWYMVKSGLIDRTEVSQYRLAAHLGLAFIIFGLTFWTALDILRPASSRSSPRGLGAASIALSLLVFIQVLLGALVAGLRAGHRFNTWPLMEGRFVPGAAGALSPFWRNLFENPATVQFDHRILAYLVAIAVGALWVAMRMRAQGTARQALDVLLGVTALQIFLGIWTLVAAVPIALGLLHQAGALILFAASLNLAHACAARAAQRAPAPVTASPAAPTRSSGSGS